MIEANAFARLTRSRLGSPVALALVLAVSALAGCDGCSCGGEETPADAGVAVPAVPQGTVAITTGYASRLPEGTQAIAVGRGFAELNSTLQILRPRFRDILDLGVLETQFREVFGVDVTQPASFNDVGISYDGGMALSVVQQQPIMAFYLTDPPAFVARAMDVLRRPPFDLRAPVREETVGDATIRLFSQRPGEPVEVAMVTTPGMAFLVKREVASVDVEVVARAIAETTAETSMAANPLFVSQVERHSADPGFVFIDVPAAISLVLEQYADQLPRGRRFTLNQTREAVTSIAASARIEGETLLLNGFATVEPGIAEQFRAISPPSSGHPHFERYYPESAFFGLRLAVDPRTAWDMVMHFQGERGAAALARRMAPVDEALGEGHTVESSIVDALGGNVMVMLNRLAPLSLYTAENSEEYADGLGALILVQLKDRDTAVAVLDAAVATEPEVYSRSQDGGDIRFHSSDPERSLGTVIVRGDTLIVMSDYMRRRSSTWSRPAGAAFELPQAVRDVPELAATISGESTNGAFLRFRSLLPIVTALRLPDALRQGLSNLDTLAVTAMPEGDGIAVSGRLELTASETNE